MALTPGNNIVKTISLDPQSYTIPAEDLALLDPTEGATGVYNPTQKFEALQLEHGVRYTLDNNTLSKRSGTHEFGTWSGSSCSGTVEGYVIGFGCGVCVTWGYRATLSGLEAGTGHYLGLCEMLMVHAVLRHETRFHGKIRKGDTI
ncbi:uncharacterized protein N7458_002020 [Penicillium daleae]|uniref:Uncharacterized protein n=1 Tax=Penicillium daleae TaxID=63821 RepID=A0AAD6CC86_9EURO|nr:uncharacterized protein N7458_002020 [Penicillium daleae]KAJ5460468.1 hypothetical protein N7458_002020 [Penicillium daleae]